jgi:uncharacterized DUF497 family protein
MEFLTIIWDDGPGGNVEHVAEHGLTPEDVEEVLNDPTERTTSRTSGGPLYRGLTSDGRYLTVVFERVDRDTIRPITAWEEEV